MTKRLAPLLLAWIGLGLLAACGGPPPVPLTLTGVSPAVALPGATVTLQGTGFRPGQVVTFDGASATVVSVASEAITVVVPSTYGYPRVEVDDVGLDGALFVGTAYAGAPTIEGVQAALDALPPGAALRLGAGTYATPGTDLDLDNRMLFGAGATTVLEVPGMLRVFAQDPHAAVLSTVRVEGGVVRIVRGRIATADAADPGVSGRVLLEGVSVDVAGMYVDVPTFQVITVRNATIVADDLALTPYGGTLTLEDSDVSVTNDAIVQPIGGDLTLRGTALAAANVLLSTVPQGDLLLEDADVTATGTVQLNAQGGSMALRGTRLAAAAELVLVSFGSVEATDSELRGTTVTVQGLFGGASFGDTSFESLADNIVLLAYGPVVVEGGRFDAATTLVLISQIAGDVTLRGTEAIDTGADLVIQDGGASFGGNNGTIRVEGNADIAVTGTFAVVPAYADLEVSGNGPTVANLVTWTLPRSHVTLRDNERIESLTDIVVVADQPGGRLTATGNAFVANAGAGTITLATQAGELTLAGNTYAGTLQTPNNP